MELPRQPIGKMSDSQVDGVPVTAAASSVAGVKETPAVANSAVAGISGEKRRRGRPPKAEALKALPVKKRKMKEDEDVCFICFDGGTLVICDRWDCPKAYHPACIKRDEAFFQSKAKWNCGWHICSKCQKHAHYMCYTCTYSLCKACAKDADYLHLRGNKGFCATCMRVINMIENIDEGNKEMVQVDFDDKTSWEYLFKVYWICLKRELSLTTEELTRAQKSYRASSKGTGRAKSSAVYCIGNNGTMMREHPPLPNKGNFCDTAKAACDNNNTYITSTAWASKELLDFVAHMKNGDTSALSQKEVQALLFDHIKRNNLRDPHQRSEIICDSKLVNLFGKPRVRHFEMLSLLEFHFLTKDDCQKDGIEGCILDPVVRQLEGETNSNNLPVIGENSVHEVLEKDEEKVNINVANEGEGACEKPGNHADSSGSTNKGPNNQGCQKSESLSGVKSETSVASLSTGSTPAVNDREENLWLYRDPNHKVQGPFGIMQLRKWSETGIFPPDLRIWSLNNEECNSVVLTDILKGQVLLQNNPPSSPQDNKGTPDSTSHHCDRRWSATPNTNGVHIDALSNDKEFFKVNGPFPPSTDWMTPAVNNNTQIENSSKCWDSDPPKDPDEAQVHCLERSSPLTERPHEASLHQGSSNVGQMCNSAPNFGNWGSQGNMIAQATDTGKQCHENQIDNSRLFLGQPSAEDSVPQTNSVSNWDSNEPQHRYASMANLTGSSEQKFSIDLQSFPTSMPETNNGECKGQTIKEQRLELPQVSVQDLCIQNVLSLTPKSIDVDGKDDFRNQKMGDVTDNYEKFPAESKHSLSLNCPAHESWSSASRLVLGCGTLLSKKATKPSIEEWDSGFLSVSSLKPHDVASNHVTTPNSKCDELVPPSPPNPVPNASSWLAMVTEPIEFSTLAEESVSDLLAEVDAMESHSDLASPNMVMDCGDDLFHDSKTDCFTSLRGLSSPLDRGKNDTTSSSGNIHLPSQSTLRDEPIEAPTIDTPDPLKRSRKHSSTISGLEVETKRFDIPSNQFDARPGRPHVSPPKKTRDLADIMNAPVADPGRGTKYGNLNSPGSTRREQGTPRGSGSKNRSTAAGFTGRESHQKHGESHQKHGESHHKHGESHQKHGGERLVSPRDRNAPGGESGVSKGRQSWNRQSSFGGGGGGGSHSRPPPRVQRVCKFYESGYCRKGAFCDYLHP